MAAVEWLFKELCSEKLSWNKDSNGKLFFDDITSDILQQAKEMEKEQIINAALYGFRRDSDGDDWQGDNYNAEKYYNETFKSE